MKILLLPRFYLNTYQRIPFPAENFKEHLEHATFEAGEFWGIRSGFSGQNFSTWAKTNEYEVNSLEQKVQVVKFLINFLTECQPAILLPNNSSPFFQLIVINYIGWRGSKISNGHFASGRNIRKPYESVIFLFYS